MEGRELCMTEESIFNLKKKKNKNNKNKQQQQNPFKEWENLSKSSLLIIFVLFIVCSCLFGFVYFVVYLLNEVLVDSQGE